jgi:hypothetical protein
MSEVSTHPEDLRGSTPVLTARDVLLEVRADVRDMKSGVDVLLSQNLHDRVTAIERWQNRLIGLGFIGAILAVLALGLQLFDRFGRVVTQ